MATITISRQFGAGGRTLGRMLAKRLGYRCIDEVIVKEISKEMNVSPGQVKGFEKEGGAGIMKFIDKVVVNIDYINRLISERYGYVDEKKYVDAVKTIVEALYQQGNVIIVGRGSQYILGNRKDVFHILLVNDLENRITFIEEKYQRKNDAKKIVNRADKNRAGFLSFFSDSQNHDDPLLYDLTINMKRVGLEKAEELVIALVSV